MIIINNLEASHPISERSQEQNTEVSLKKKFLLYTAAPGLARVPSPTDFWLADPHDHVSQFLSWKSMNFSLFSPSSVLPTGSVSLEKPDWYRSVRRHFETRCHKMSISSQEGKSTGHMNSPRKVARRAQSPWYTFKGCIAVQQIHTKSL